MIMKKTALKTILVVGSLNVDLVASVQDLPQQGETIVGNKFTTFSGGKGANQAVAAGKLGACVSMVGCIGRDVFANNLLVSLKASDVNTDFVRQVATATGTALITVNEDGNNTIVVVGGANMECNVTDVDHALENYSQPGILLLQNEIPQETVEYAIKAGNERGWMVIFNPAPARKIAVNLMPMVDIIILDENELALLTDSSVDTRPEVIAAAQKLLDSGVKHVIVTMGDKGALCCNESGNHHVSSYVVKNVDTTAAGDAYAGGLAAALGEGKTLEESMKFAAAVAALAVTKHGAQPSLPRRIDVGEFISSEGINK